MDLSILKIETAGSTGQIKDMELDRLPHPSTWRVDFGPAVHLVQGRRVEARLSFPVEVEVIGKLISEGDSVSIPMPPLTREEKDAAHVALIGRAVNALNHAIGHAFKDGLDVELTTDAPYPTDLAFLGVHRMRQPYASASVSRPVPTFVPGPSRA